MFKTLVQIEQKSRQAVSRGILIVSVELLFLLAGCDPCNPVGFREVGMLRAEIDPEMPLIAVYPFWGPCGIAYYCSYDSGLKWTKQKGYLFYDTEDMLVASADCTYACRFVDPINDEIHYRIVAGKTLERSWDGGETWQTELRAPAWNWMERNYVLSKFGEIGPFDRLDIRGPFSAITDPKTGNLIIAMGLEGLLIRSKEHEWINPDMYKPIQPTREEMIGLINPQEWWRTPVIALALILFGLGRAGFHRFRPIHTLILVLAAWSIIIPFGLNQLAVMQIFFSDRDYLFTEGTFPPKMLFLPILVVTAALAIWNGAVAWRKKPALLRKLGGLSFGAGLTYGLVFLAWSQGFLLGKYKVASMIGYAVVITAAVLISLLVKKNAGASLERKSKQ